MREKEPAVGYVRRDSIWEGLKERKEYEQIYEKNKNNKAICLSNITVEKREIAETLEGAYWACFSRQCG